MGYYNKYKGGGQVKLLTNNFFNTAETGYRAQRNPRSESAADVP